MAMIHSDEFKRDAVRIALISDAGRDQSACAPSLKALLVIRRSRLA